jgi:hypothetical protein
LASIEVREPFINEKEMTPITIIKEQNILSIVFVPLMSPYPIVVMVVIVQYKERVYSYRGVLPTTYFSSQVPE